MKIKIGNEVLTIERSDCDDGFNPRDDDNIGKMLCFHDRYSLGDKLDFDDSECEDWKSIEKKLKKENNAVVILPLYLYDHSGITMKTSSFSCQWDSGRVGFIYATKENVIENFGKLTKANLAKVKKSLENEVIVYDQFISGEVYAFSIVKEVECKYCGVVSEEHIDSCSGFYGDDVKENGMLEHIPKKWHKKIVNEL